MSHLVAAALRVLRRRPGSWIAGLLLGTLALTSLGSAALAHRADSATAPGTPLAAVQLCTASSDVTGCRGRAVTPRQQEDVRRLLEGLRPGVGAIDYVSAQEGKRRFDTVQRGSEPHADVAVDQIAPAFHVALDDPSDVARVRADLDGLPGVQRVLNITPQSAYAADGLTRLMWAGLGLTAVLSTAWMLGSAATVAHLALVVRRRLQIAREAGARPGRLRAPFRIAAAATAVAAATVASGLLFALVQWVLPRLDASHGGVVAALARLDGGDVLHALPWVWALAALGVLPGVLASRRHVRP